MREIRFRAIPREILRVDRDRPLVIRHPSVQWFDDPERKRIYKDEGEGRESREADRTRVCMHPLGNGWWCLLEVDRTGTHPGEHAAPGLVQRPVESTPNGVAPLAKK